MRLARKACEHAVSHGDNMLTPSMLRDAPSVILRCSVLSNNTSICPVTRPVAVLVRSWISLLWPASALLLLTERAAGAGAGATHWLLVHQT